ncbi:MAG TPA: glycosyltransferase family 4 protein [Anaeromyxobacteraceae bacterium]|nr:glycosyltransferase family 4 protein [Anaeromyxobacteraceae bacterium]
MRIAYLVNMYPRPSVSFIRREIQALEAQGVEVLRFSQRPLDGPLPTEADRREAERTRFILAEGPLGHAVATAAVALWRPAAFARALRAAARLGWRSDRGLARHAVYLAEACVLFRWLARAPVDHLHAHFGSNPAAVALLCRLLGGPTYSFTVHGPEEFDKPAFLGLPEKIRHAAFVVAVSSYGRAQLWRWARFEDWGKVQVVRCGLDGDFLGAPLTPAPAAPRFVCVARLNEQKGHLLLVEAVARLREEGREVEVLLVGDGPLRPQIEDAIGRLGVAASVRILGWASAAQVREAILSSRALLLPSFAEGLPVVLMEALALGRPAITTAIAGVPELVEPGVSGWLVPAGAVEPLVDAMREALDAPTARLEAMGRAGAARVALRHDARVEARRLSALFRQAAEARRGEGGREAAGGVGTPSAESVQGSGLPREPIKLA